MWCRLNSSRLRKSRPFSPLLPFHREICPNSCEFPRLSRGNELGGGSEERVQGRGRGDRKSQGLPLLRSTQNEIKVNFLLQPRNEKGNLLSTTGVQIFLKNEVYFERTSSADRGVVWQLHLSHFCPFFLPDRVMQLCSDAAWALSEMMFDYKSYDLDTLTLRLYIAC